MATFGEDRPTRRCSWPSLRRQLIAYPLCGPQALVRSDQMLYENPDLYDALLPVSENQLNFYVTLAQRSPGGVLELGCGSGQLIVPIAAKSMPAVGLDTSHEMLAAARRRARAAGVRVELVEGDMRGFELGRQFSLILYSNRMRFMSRTQPRGTQLPERRLACLHRDIFIRVTLRSSTGAD